MREFRTDIDSPLSTGRRKINFNISRIIVTRIHNINIIADAMQKKHTSVFKVNDLKNIESIVENSTYVGFAIPEE